MNDERNDSGHAHAEPTAAAANPAYRAEAQRLFLKEILPRWTAADNVWRSACALDSILDYFLVSGADSAPYGDDALAALDPTKLGNWWDDFGWIGIAALRAAELGFAAAHRTDFLKIAINAWSYMHGPGWSLSPHQRAIYPFTDVPGWAQFAREHTSNSGAPNVWDRIDQTWPNPPPATKAQLRPRYSPGGVWNAPISAGSAPTPVPAYSASADYLSPVQNTVTNGVYTVLGLRLYLATQNPNFASVFRDAGFNAQACLQAWQNQIQWYGQWMLGPQPADQSLLLKPSAPTGGLLVRERVSTFHPVGTQLYWDAAYRKPLSWMGDQGLLIGALREAQGMHLVPKPAVVDLYPNLIHGAFANAFRPRTYGQVNGSFPLPWLDLDVPNPFWASSPGNDDGDYQTGVGVLMRYLLQAYRADASLLTPYRSMILGTANALVQPGFGVPPPSQSGSCDAFTPAGGSNADLMTAYVNRLSVLTLAIAMG